MFERTSLPGNITHIYSNTGTSLITIASKCRVVIASLFEDHSFRSPAPIDNGEEEEKKNSTDVGVALEEQQSRHLTPNVMRWCSRHNEYRNNEAQNWRHHSRGEFHHYMASGSLDSTQIKYQKSGRTTSR